MSLCSQLLSTWGNVRTDHGDHPPTVSAPPRCLGGLSCLRFTLDAFLIILVGTRREGWARHEIPQSPRCSIWRNFLECTVLKPLLAEAVMLYTRF